MNDPVGDNDNNDKDDDPPRLAIIINNEGHCIGGFTLQEDSGGDRLLDIMPAICDLLDLRLLVTHTHYFAIMPKLLRNDVIDFLAGYGAQVQSPVIKTPGRG